PTPAPGASSALRAVAAVSADDVWAVGERAGPATLVEHWDGRRWRVVPSPTSPEVGGSRLTAVAAVSANDVWAVGGTGDEFVVPYVLHWNGRVWRTVDVPHPPITDNGLGLRAVTALAANDVWAVGASHLTEHWDGHAWRIVPAPEASTDPDGTTAFNGVAARSARDVWAVGLATDPAGPRTVTAHWNGIAWTLVPSPDPGTRLNILNAVVAPARGPTVAVGYQGRGIVTQTLIIRHRG